MVIKERGRSDLAFFAAYFFPEYIKANFSEFHLDAFALKVELELNRNQYWILAAPRGNAKSTIITLFWVIHAIVYKTERFIVVVSNTAEQAIERTVEIRDHLEDNEKLRRVFGSFINRKKWNQNDFTASNGVRVMAKSVGSEIRGTRNKADRPSMFIFDDLESQETINSPAVRNKTRVWFDTAAMKAGYSSGPWATNFVFIGTLLHKQSLMSIKVNSPRWKSRIYKAIKSWSTRQDLWDLWKDIIIDRSRGDSRFDEAEAFYYANEEEMMQGVEVLWQDGESYYQLQLQLIDGGRSAFNSEKQNDPRDPDSQLFVMDEARTFDLMKKSFTGTNEMEQVNGREIFLDRRIYYLYRSDGKTVMLSDLKIFGFLDPAMAKRLKSDFAGIVVVGIESETKDAYVLDAWLDKVPPSKQVKKIFDLHSKWKFEKFGFEDNVFQALLAETFEKEAALRSTVLQVEGISHYKNKEDRISSMEPDLANGWLLFNSSLRNTEYWDQFELFPTGTHDDGPDATQACLEVAGVSRMVA